MAKISVLIVDKGIDSKGVIANTAFVLGLTAGREISADTFGEDVVDGDGMKHKYLTKIGHLVRKAGQNKIRTLREEFADRDDILVIDYTEEAAPADYDQYTCNLSSHCGEEIKYRALYIRGPADVILPPTKNLPRL